MAIRKNALQQAGEGSAGVSLHCGQWERLPFLTRVATPALRAVSRQHLRTIDQTSSFVSIFGDDCISVSSVDDDTPSACRVESGDHVLAEASSHDGVFDSASRAAMREEWDTMVEQIIAFLEHRREPIVGLYHKMLRLEKADRGDECIRRLSPEQRAAGVDELVEHCVSSLLQSRPHESLRHVLEDQAEIVHAILRDGLNDVFEDVERHL
eukprot:TRINITY_DN16461_c0_g1_i1.p1 TRINITY_DN16461_c0_g1~~TRINITY_DN16461_c0_g1_i1.p1  ORF type:complete len:226 (+),score=39.03 TRINITY_DN16461_c0_g1_i1:49-678(+)